MIKAGGAGACVGTCIGQPLVHCAQLAHVLGVATPSGVAEAVSAASTAAATRPAATGPAAAGAAATGAAGVATATGATATATASAGCVEILRHTTVTTTATSTSTTTAAHGKIPAATGLATAAAATSTATEPTAGASAARHAAHVRHGGCTVTEARFAHQHARVACSATAELRRQAGHLGVAHGAHRARVQGWHGGRLESRRLRFALSLLAFSFALLGRLGTASATRDLMRLHAARAGIHRLAVRDTIAFLQQLVDHVISMDKQIGATIILLDETEALLIVKELHQARLRPAGAGHGHRLSSTRQTAATCARSAGPTGHGGARQGPNGQATIQAGEAWQLLRTSFALVATLTFALSTSTFSFTLSYGASAARDVHSLGFSRALVETLVEVHLVTGLQRATEHIGAQHKKILVGALRNNKTEALVAVVFFHHSGVRHGQNSKRSIQTEV
mmetsp:Transcript_57602/g.126045  ORF Transcript_57602/g.126045 Transcript_57602/m.126045 type:complete len:448 (-) Transcript_57602:45-1388(-)